VGVCLRVTGPVDSAAGLVDCGGGMGAGEWLGTSFASTRLFTGTAAALRAAPSHNTIHTLHNNNND